MQKNYIVELKKLVHRLSVEPLSYNETSLSSLGLRVRYGKKNKFILIFFSSSPKVY
jgi:hypothetical protein